jgi:hypothetical protein
MHLKAIRLYDVERIIPTLGAPFAGFGRSALWQSLATSGFDLALELARDCCEIGRYFFALAGMRRSLFKAASSRKRSWS